MHNLYVGLISGTSMDGIDAVLVDLQDHEFKLLCTHQHDYDDELRDQLLEIVRRPNSCTIDVLGELDTWVGECFRDAAVALIHTAGASAESVAAIGSHGQTLRHRPDAVHRFTLQIGNPTIISTGTGITTVADFRRTDLALGGEGAPLTPAFHEWLFRDENETRLVLNIGGIANITLLPAGDTPISGFDTGPGNTLLDAWTRRHRKQAFDDAGQWAASGRVNEALLAKLLADSWFAKTPPKSTGFEYFNMQWLLAAGVDNLDPVDVQATLSELSAHSIADAVMRHAAAGRIFVCGGGAHNPDLLERLARYLPNVSLSSTIDAGLDPDWVEAAAFAWLAKMRLQLQPGSYPGVTGATRPAVLGAIYNP